MVPITHTGKVTHLLQTVTLPSTRCKASLTVKYSTCSTETFCTRCRYILLLVTPGETDFLLQQEHASVPSHSSTPTSLCRHGFFLSSNTMLFLSYSPCCFPFSLSSSFSVVTQHLLSNTLALLGEAELLSSLPLSPPLFFQAPSAFPSVYPFLFFALSIPFLVLFPTITLVQRLPDQLYVSTLFTLL